MVYKKNNSKIKIKNEDVRPHDCMLFSGLFLVQSVMIVQKLLTSSVVTSRTSSICIMASKFLLELMP